MSTLDKIREEIQKDAEWWFDHGEDLRGDAVLTVLDIIDKYADAYDDCISRQGLKDALINNAFTNKGGYYDPCHKVYQETVIHVIDNQPSV